MPFSRNLLGYASEKTKPRAGIRRYAFHGKQTRCRFSGMEAYIFCTITSAGTPLSVTGIFGAYSAALFLMRFYEITEHSIIKNTLYLRTSCGILMHTSERTAKAKKLGKTV